MRRVASWRNRQRGVQKHRGMNMLTSRNESPRCVRSPLRKTHKPVGIDVWAGGHFLGIKDVHQPPWGVRLLQAIHPKLRTERVGPLRCQTSPNPQSNLSDRHTQRSQAPHLRTAWRRPRDRDRDVSRRSVATGATPRRETQRKGRTDEPNGG